MTSRKEKKPSLDGTGDLSDLLLGGAGGGLVAGSAGGLDSLLRGQPDLVNPIGEIDAANMSNEEVANHEVSATLQAFKDRAKAEQARFELATDSEYWIGVCFQTRAQKEFFLKAVKLLQAGDKYIDGRLLAKRMGIELPEANVPYNVSARPDAKLAAIVRGGGSA